MQQFALRTSSLLSARNSGGTESRWTAAISVCFFLQVLLQAQKELLRYRDTGISVLGEPAVITHSCKASVQRLTPILSPPTRNESPIVRLQQNPGQNEESGARAAVSASSAIALPFFCLCVRHVSWRCSAGQVKARPLVLVACSRAPFYAINIWCAYL